MITRTLSENPVWFRARRTYSKTDWSYALWVLVPAFFCLSSGPSGKFLAMFFAGAFHYLYFAGRSLVDGMNFVLREREAKTLEELQGTGISEVTLNWTYYLLGLKRRAPAFLLMPVTAIFFHGEVSASEFLAIFAITVVLAVAYTGIGMMVGAYCSTRTRAQGLGYTVLGLHFFGSLFLLAFSEQALMMVNPVACSIGFLEPAGRGALGKAFECFFLHSLLALMVGFLSVDAWKPQQTAPKASKRRRWRPAFENPILYRELDFQLPWMLPVVLCGPPFASAVLDSDTGRGWYFGLMALVIYICFKAGSSAEDSLGGERRQKSLDVLLSTRLSPSQVVWSKALAVMIPLWIGLLASLPFIAIAILQKSDQGVAEVLAFTVFLAIGVWAVVCFQLRRSVTQEAAGGGPALVTLFIVAIIFATMGNSVTWMLLHPILAAFAMLQEPHLLLVAGPLYLAFGAHRLNSAVRHLEEAFSAERAPA